MLNCEQLSSPISKKDFFIDCLQEFLQNHMENHIYYGPWEGGIWPRFIFFLSHWLHPLASLIGRGSGSCINSGPVMNLGPKVCTNSGRRENPVLIHQTIWKPILLEIKEDRAVVTLGILIKIPPNLLLDLSPITLGRIKMFSKFTFLCLQNMVSGQQLKYIILPHPGQPHLSWGSRRL